MTSGATIRTACPYCGVGCGVRAKVSASGAVAVEGDREHPANFGRLCSKGSALGETMALDDRLLEPMIDGGQATWSQALDLVAARFSETIAKYGPDSVAFYVSGQILTEDYYVANKLAKGFIGTANIDTNSRLCMASSVAGHRRAFGADTVPGNYEDLEQADVVVLVGSNLAWCHPVLFQRLLAAKEQRGTRIVVVDPRRTASAEAADLHLALAPGSDVALFNGLLVHLFRQNAIDRGYVWRHTSGLRSALAKAYALDEQQIAAATGLSTEQISAFYRLFQDNERVVTVYSQGVNQSTAGTDKVNAIINCHLMTGRIGRPGMGPLSVTGQPNAMGGREVGGLANMLAAHMDIENAEHRGIVAKFWKTPRVASKPGFKAVDMFRAVADGRIKALWIMATNPVDSMPEADGVRAAIEACPFVVVSDVTRTTDTTVLADVLLPSLAWGEKDGTVTNTERRITRQRAFLPPPGQAKADWWQLAQVAQRMGFKAAFAWNRADEIFAEYAALTGFENAGSRDLDISAHRAIGQADYDALAPFQWPQPAGFEPRETRFFADGGFYTPDRRARFVPTPFRLAATQASAEYPLILNTGRIRDQWHTMTRTSKAPRLMGHFAEPFVEVHPSDAVRFGLSAAGLAQVTSAHGSVVVRVLVTDRQRAGSVFVPMHWTDQLASRGRVDALIAGETDPISGQPELKHGAVAIKPYAAAWFGFGVSAAKPVLSGGGYWALAAANGGWRIEMADIENCVDPAAMAREIFQIADGDDGVELLAYHDAANGQHRIAAFRDGRLAGALFIAREPVAAPRGWITEQLIGEAAIDSSRLRLLAGRAPANAPDRGAIVCACFEVGFNQIAAAVTTGGCMSVAAVGAALQAGTNCGSCRTEIGRIIDANRLAKAG